ncbi:MAG: DUF5333 domain-containing protein [Pseudomonadota bacterium]
MKTLCAALLGMSLFTTSVLAKPPLRDVPAIDDAIFEIGVAHLIRENCASIEARQLKGVAMLLRLRREARDMGYSDAEIEAYTDSDADKARLRAKAATYFAARGVDPTQPEHYCQIGREEIAKASRIGSLLKAK